MKTLDCKLVDARLGEIAKEAQAARKMLANANTGRDFDLALKVIMLHAGAIRKEVYNETDTHRMK